MVVEQNIYNQINNILTDWNPLNVEGPALKDEYSGFIPSLMRDFRDFNNTIKNLLSMISQLGFYFDEQDDTCYQDLKNIATKINQIVM